MKLNIKKKSVLKMLDICSWFQRKTLLEQYLANCQPNEKI